ncbi:hypothetical protein LOTGIDRAFT_203779 [Lottia gigantea]|uniref:DNA-directed RNA polymerase subunit n=1 Tax=Lottia gigantea TaxID=225164 RepID=V3ZZG2_LOTGI|nr:hypothetical protein LOTGIDRAFT_203779 [Lottia gigantea]ESO96928.1 hypothetical protein LOTGIDRAFT_203779 [Lottia gigantea]
MDSSSVFETDLNFCPDCGTILPLPSKEEFVQCVKCRYKLDLKKFHGISTEYKLTFNKIEDMITDSRKDSEEATSGPLTDRVCSNCGNEGMTYTTRQTRSADEGQTVFYSCPECKHQEIEYS